MYTSLVVQYSSEIFFNWHSSLSVMTLKAFSVFIIYDQGNGRENRIHKIFHTNMAPL